MSNISKILPEPKGWYSRGYIPHVDVPGLIQHISIHLAGSLPRSAIQRIQARLDLLPDSERKRELRKQANVLLDKGLGACWLGKPQYATIVEQSLQFGDGQRYRLLAWAIMPNHVHALVETQSDWRIHKVVQAWKRHTTREITQSMSRSSVKEVPNKIWHRGYWDRFVRDDEHLIAVTRYIEENPVRAGLVAINEDWPWNSARRREPATSR